MTRLKKAHWIQHTHLFRADTYECSNCGNVEQKAFAKCPCCRRVMTGNEYDPSWVSEMEFPVLIFDGK